MMTLWQVIESLQFSPRDNYIITNETTGDVYFVSTEDGFRNQRFDDTFPRLMIDEMFDSWKYERDTGEKDEYSWR